MFKKLDIRGVSHHFLLPVIAVLVVAGIGGVIMQRSSSAYSETRKCSSIIVGRYKNYNVKPCVKAIQRKVGAKQDGIYGDNTKAKVKVWQKAHGLYADGTVGPKTWAKMGIHPTYKVSVNNSSKKTTSFSKMTTAQRRAYCAKIGEVYNSTKKTCEDKNAYKISVKTFNYVQFPAKPNLVIKSKRVEDGNARRAIYARNETAQAKYDKARSAYNLTQSYLTTSMAVTTLKTKCNAIGGGAHVISKSMEHQSEWRNKRATHDVCVLN